MISHGLSQRHGGEHCLTPLFQNNAEYKLWQEHIAQHQIKSYALQPGEQEVFLGIDSGSTTTKVVVLDKEQRMLFSDYRVNQGSPIASVEGLNIFTNAPNNTIFIHFVLPNSSAILCAAIT